MIVRVLDTGKDAGGLTRYLFGPGKANEHTNQRIVAGSPELVGEWSGTALTMREATHLGRIVESAWRRQYAPELAMAGLGSGGIAREALHSAVDERRPGVNPSDPDHGALASKQDHVFHTTISLGPNEGAFTDEQWNEVASKYMEAMGFIGQADHDDASWYAVHHGLSKEGNDHIHIVACTTLRDGSSISLHNSGRRSQTIRRDVLEKLAFVTPLHEENRAHNTPRPSSFTAAEHNIAVERAAKGAGPATPDRVLLQRALRAAATSAGTEAEFINNVIKTRRDPDRAGIEIMPPAAWKPGTTVRGYKVRWVPTKPDSTTGKPVAEPGNWFSAATLSPDLTLGKLRPAWRPNESDDTRSYAAALWAGQAGGVRTPAHDPREELRTAAAELTAAADAIVQLDPDDVAAWNHVEAATAGTAAIAATASMRGVHEDGRACGFDVDAGRAADVLARQWLADAYATEAGDEPRVPEGLSHMEIAARHLQLAARASSTDRHNGWLAVIQQLGRTMDAIAAAKQARGELVAAGTLRHDAVASMVRLDGWLQGQVLSDAAIAAREGSAHGRPVTREAVTQRTDVIKDGERYDGPGERRGRGPRRA